MSYGQCSTSGEIGTVGAGQGTGYQGLYQPRTAIRSSVGGARPARSSMAVWTEITGRPSTSVGKSMASAVSGTIGQAGIGSTVSSPSRR